ncbi:hypothetical protein BCON_0216g00140 [Botryotinia convoluta]|uniref:Uncharacterized protein n=1 Tax=Botryotinia convoluta TaxID=54673 RepID=A0A4Z1HR63_9HELO|nr:hypothetical protein BCON_0216g00140 [Botryotinia convoluta]
MARRFKKSNNLQTGPPPDKKDVNFVRLETPRIQDRPLDSYGAKIGMNERMFYKSHRDSKPVAATELQDTSNAAKHPMLFSSAYDPQDPNSVCQMTNQAKLPNLLVTSPSQEPVIDSRLSSQSYGYRILASSIGLLASRHSAIV